MRARNRFLMMGGLGLAAALPSSALAERPHADHAPATRSPEIHLFFEQTSSVSSDTGFTTTDAVSYGNAVEHGPVVGLATLQCTFLTDSKANCTASLVIYKKGSTTAVDKSVFLTNELVNLRNPVYVIQGGTGDWAKVKGGAVVVRSVSDTTLDAVVHLEF